MMKKLRKIIEIATLAKSALFPNYQRYRSEILLAQTEDLNEDCVKISHPFRLYVQRNGPLKSVTVGIQN